MQIQVGAHIHKIQLQTNINFLSLLSGKEDLNILLKFTKCHSHNYPVSATRFSNYSVFYKSNPRILQNGN